LTNNNPRSPKTRKPLNKLLSNQPTSKVDQDVAKTERKLGRNLHSVRASSTQKTVVKGPRFKEEIKTQKCTPGNKTARGAKLSDKAEEPSKKVFRTSSSTATLPTVKPLDKKTPSDYGVTLSNNVTLLSVEPPAERKGGIKVGSVAELVEKLKNEAKVLS
jgi:hypothetical protein